MSGGLHERFERETAAQASSERAFGLVFATVFALVGLWPLTGEGGGVRLWSLAIGAGFLAAALLRPALLAPLNRLWTRFGLLLHKVVSPVILAAIFAVAIVPTGLLMRLFKRDPMQRRFEPDAESYWITRDPAGPDPASMKRQF